MNKIPGVSRIHGNIFDKEINGNKVKVVPIYHPAAVLYRPQLWDEFEKDFNIVKSILDNKNE
jgi:DNA polymerase